MSKRRVKQHLIYVLRDPDTSEVRYVGRSSLWMGRPRYHIAHAAKRSPDGSWVSELYVHRWIRMLLEVGKEPSIDVIEELNRTDDVNDRLNEAERRWIAKLREEGCQLTNMTDGGMGMLGYRHTEKAKIAIGAAALGREFSEESCRKISEALIGNQNCLGREVHHSDATKEKLRNANLGKRRPGQAGENHWLSRTGRPSPMKGKSHTLEAREKNKTAHLGVRYLNRRGKAVVCLNDGREFASQQQAADACGLTKLQVSRSCRLGREFAGLRFSFVGV